MYSLILFSYYSQASAFYDLVFSFDVTWNAYSQKFMGVTF